MLFRNINVKSSLCRLFFVNGRFLTQPNVTFWKTYATPSQQQHQIYKRVKPLCNICTIGSLQHGKTTLTSAITKYLSKKNLAKFMTHADIDNKVDEKERGYSIHVTNVNYDTEKRHYVHSDCPGHTQHIKNLIPGISHAKAAILVLDVNTGPQQQTIEHMQIAKLFGIDNIIVFLNKVDDAKDKDRIEVAELEVRESLFDAGYDGDKVPVVLGSALYALEGKDPSLGNDSITKLLDTIDNIPNPIYDMDKPFLVPVLNIFNITGKGLVVAGFVERGVVRKNTECEIIGYNKKSKTTTKELERFYQTFEEAQAGDWMTTLIGGVQRDDIKRGMVLCKPGTADIHDHAEVQFHMLPFENKGPHDDSIQNHSQMMIHSQSWECTSMINIEDKEDIKPGEDCKLRLILNKSVFMENGQRFIIRNHLRTLGGGVITKVLPNLTPDDKLKMEKERKLRKRIKQ